MAQTHFLPPPVTATPSSPNLHVQLPATPFAYYIPLQNIGPGAPRGNASIPLDDLKAKAWKYEGYKEFSKWMASDDDFFVFRRFGRLNAGVVLWMQDRITQIETRLDEIHDQIANSPDDEYLKNSSFRWDVKHQQERDNLMSQLSGLLHHYNQYIETYSKVRQRPRAEQRQILNVRNWLTRNAITEEEQKFVQHEGDLVAVNSRVQPPLGRLLEACKLLRLSRFLKEKLSPDVHIVSDYTTYSSNELLEGLSNATIILLGFAMLMGPLWWLNSVSDSSKRLGIISGFLGLFMVLMMTATVNAPFQVVASSAAYAAVLMVFMQIGGK